MHIHIYVVGSNAEKTKYPIAILCTVMKVSRSGFYAWKVKPKRNMGLLKGWLYLAVVIDLFSRRIVEYELDNHQRTSLPLQALEKAISLGVSKAWIDPPFR